jgi:hypothetical protein
VFCSALGHTHDESVKEFGAAAHQIFVPAGERVEGSWVYGCMHCTRITALQGWFSQY